jgi:hypothetical protein
MQGWKTIMFNAILVLVGLAEASGLVLPESFAADLNGVIIAVVGVVGVVLRAVTSSPVGWTKDEKNR